MSTTDSDRVSVPVQSRPAPETAQANRVIDLDAPRAVPSQRTRSDVVRDAMHTGACVLAGLLITTGFLLDPTNGEEGAELLAVVADAPDRFYAANTMAAFGLVLVGAVGLAVLRLVRGRGRVVGTVAGMLMIIGGAASAAGIFMYGALATVMATSGLDRDTMVSLEEQAGDSLRTGLTFFIGFPGMMLGMVLCVVALLVSRAVAVWVPAAMAAGLLVVVTIGSTAYSTIGDALLTVAFTGIGLALWRATAGAPRA